MLKKTFIVAFLCAAMAACGDAAIQDGETSEAARSASAPSACRLGDSGKISHVIYIQFDNTHLRRDRAHVPSDLEQMPHLLDFIRGRGTMITNDHTILISHTAGGILSSLTGVYPDRHGQTVSNSYVRISPTGSFSFPSSFGYWTDTVSGSIPNMVTPTGANAPAPWVAYTRAGCDVGAVASANIVLENTGTGPTGDVTKVFGNPSPQASEAIASAAAPAGTAARARAQTDFVGLAVHCAQGSALCAAGHDDALPGEPGGYTGFKGLFGAQEINPALVGGPTVTDLDGNAVVDPFGQSGFPGFDGMSAAVSLAYVAEMQEQGIPVTFAYISDAHDFHGVSGNQHTAFGPGSEGYVEQLAAYDRAFAAFFERLARDGIDERNTLFVFTVDEGDHFVGGSPTPETCDGIHVPCDWTGQVGEINANIDTLVAHQFPALAAQFLGAAAPFAFTVHGDDAPTFYLAQKGAGALGQTDPAVRELERSVADLTAVNPYTGANDHLLAQMADQTGMRTLHMITDGDPARNATFVFFADPNYFLTDFPSTTCETCINPAFAWNHGDIQKEIAQTWLGFVGPGVKHRGFADVWTDHTDVRPTILALLHLADPYELDGRVVTEILDRRVVPRGLAAHGELSEILGAVYKQVNAPFGRLSRDALAASTRALAGDDDAYAELEADIADLTARRDALAAEVRTALNAAAFAGTAIDERQAWRWIARGERLLDEAADLARDRRHDRDHDR
jgi:hypothetical protein